MVKYYTGIAGTEVTDLTSNAKYPGTPDEVRTLTKGSLETESDAGDNYGAVLEGFVKAPVTGKYRFLLSTPNSAQVWVQKNPEADGDAFGMTKVVELTMTSNPTQEVEGDIVVEWAAGKLYFIKAILKQATQSGPMQIGMQIVDGVKYMPIPLSMCAGTGNTVVPDPGVDRSERTLNINLLFSVSLALSCR